MSTTTSRATNNYFDKKSETNTIASSVLNRNSESSVMMPPRHTYIARLILGMRQCLQALGVAHTNAQLERWAILVHQSMSSSSRNYHSVNHVFDLSKGQTDPIVILSCYFHDCIYCHVDGGLSPSQASILAGVGHLDGSSVKLTDASNGDDELLAMVRTIFGLSPGQVLTTTGINEFLSSVFAVRELRAAFVGAEHTKYLAQIAGCIEATIPFRPPNDRGETPMDQLYLRMQQVNDEFQLGMSDSEVVKAVQRAAVVANRDVHNFCTTDRAWFLDNTWSLLPETNESLRQQYLYTVQDFQHAVFKMSGFFSFLKPSLVFSSFRGVPSPEEMEYMTTEASRNLEVGRKYVSARLLSVSLLAAFATLTGGDGPMSLFTGDLPSRQHMSRRLEEMLPALPHEKLDHPELCDKDAYEILLHGRKKETRFDIRQSPMAAYIYGRLGDAGVQKILRDITVYPMTSEKAVVLLMAIPRPIVCLVAENMAKIAISRADKILEVMGTLWEGEN